VNPINLEKEKKCFSLQQTWGVGTEGGKREREKTGKTRRGMGGKVVENQKIEIWATGDL